MYNDRNQQNYHRARPTPAARATGDLPRLDADQGGRRCDGSLDRTSCGQVPNERTSCNQALRDRAQRGQANDLKLREQATGGHWMLHDHPLAMVYSPYQHFREIYTPDTALDRGTLFSELDLPFEGGNRRNGGCAR